MANRLHNFKMFALLPRTITINRISATANKWQRKKQKRRKIMNHIKTKCIIGLVILLTVGGVALASLPIDQAKDDARTPDLPSPICDTVQAPAGSKLAFHAYAIGVQVYRWNGMSWDFVAPIARLFADANYCGEVGSHYAGPTWESNSGSKVVARRLYGCAPDSTSIPWLLL